jgi:PIN domain nuclease of toxin-antitoxin system
MNPEYEDDPSRDRGCRLATLDFRRDPADELIAATSRLVHSVPLLTRDRKLLASQQIPLA